MYINSLQMDADLKWLEQEGVHIFQYYHKLGFDQKQWYYLTLLYLFEILILGMCSAHS